MYFRVRLVVFSLCALPGLSKAQGAGVLQRTRTTAAPQHPTEVGVRDVEVTRLLHKSNQERQSVPPPFFNGPRAKPACPQLCRERHGQLKQG